MRCAVHFQLQSKCLSLPRGVDLPLEAQVVLLQPVSSPPHLLTSSQVSSPLTLLATKANLSIIRALGAHSWMAPSSLSWDPHAHSCPWEPHCSSQGLSYAALQVICAQSYSPSPVSFTEFSRLTKREWSHVLSRFVWYWKACWESWLSAFQFSSLLFIHLQTHFHFSNFVIKEDGKFTPRWGHLVEWISKAVYHCLTVTGTRCCVTGWVIHLSLWWMVQQRPKLPLTFFLSY